MSRIFLSLPAALMRTRAAWIISGAGENVAGVAPGDTRSTPVVLCTLTRAANRLFCEGRGSTPKVGSEG